MMLMRLALAVSINQLNKEIASTNIYRQLIFWELKLIIIYS